MQLLWYVRSLYVGVEAESFFCVYKELLSFLSLYSCLPKMISDNLDKALVLIHNQRIKRIGEKIASVFLEHIFGTRSLTQLLWYARPSYMGVAPGFFL